MPDEVQHDNPPPKESMDTAVDNTDVAATASDVQNVSMVDFVKSKVEGFEDKKESDPGKGREETDDVEKKDALDSPDESDKKEDKADEDKKEEPKEGEEAKVEDEAAVEAAKDPVPYQRFEEVNREKNELKQRYEAVEPVVKNYNSITTFCSDYAITPDQFQKALEIQALLNTNPDEALKRLEPIYQALQGFQGNKLPADLQSKVDAGRMDLEDAREFAKLRARKEFGENNAKQQQKRLEAMQAENYKKEVQQSIASWEQTKRGLDPDYQPKKGAEAPDGMWEDVRDKFLALLNRVDDKGNFVNQVKTPAEMVSMMERAYTEVKAKYTAINGRSKPPTKNRLTSTGSSKADQSLAGKNIEDAKTMSEAIHIGLAQRTQRAMK